MGYRILYTTPQGLEVSRSSGSGLNLIETHEKIVLASDGKMSSSKIYHLLKSLPFGVYRYFNFSR